MKKFYLVELIILIMADLTLGLTIISPDAPDFRFTIILIDLLVGLAQAVPALVMIFINRFHNKYFWSYIILAICTITTLVLSASINYRLYEESIILNLFYFSFLLAHYFIFILYKTAQLNKAL